MVDSDALNLLSKICVLSSFLSVCVVGIQTLPPKSPLIFVYITSALVFSFTVWIAFDDREPRIVVDDEVAGLLKLRSLERIHLSQTLQGCYECISNVNTDEEVEEMERMLNECSNMMDDIDKDRR